MIFDKIPIYLLLLETIILLEIILITTMIFFIIYKFYQNRVQILSLYISSKNIHFITNISMKILDEGLENDRGKGTDHFHTFLNITKLITNFFLSLLASISDSIPDIIPLNTIS